MSFIDEFGYHRTRLDERLATLEASLRGIFGADIDLGVETPDGQHLGILAEALSDLDALIEEVYNGRSPAGATGAGLARLVRLNGITKKTASFSQVTLTLTGVVGTVVPAGSLVASSLDPTAVFATETDVTFIASTATVQALATVAGPILSGAGNLTTRLTVIAGWTAVTNVSDATPGALGETDAQLRARRAESVALPSQGIVDGLEAALLQVPNLTQVVVRENAEDTLQVLDDGGPLAAHAIQVIARNGSDADIANAIWLKRSAGCTMVGGTSVLVADLFGVSHAVKFDRAIESPIYVAVHAVPPLASDVQLAVKNAIVARGNGTLTVGGVPLPGSKIGELVAVSDLYDAITYLRLTSIPGLKVGEIDIGIAPSPTSDATIVLPYNWIATWAAVNITFP